MLPAPATEPARAPAAPHVPAASDPVDESGRPEQSGFGGEPAAEQGERQLGATEREPGELTAPLGISRTPTQNPEVDAGLDRLGGLDHLPIDGHLEVYEDVHQGLRDVLDALDQRPGPGPRVPAPSPHHHRS
nr:hypothetical protein [Streptomyces zagrosensis]